MRYASLVLLSVLSVSAHAQTYPTKPIRVIVPFTAGSLPDLVPRLVGEKAGPALGQPLVVENRVGAGGRIAAEAVSKAAPDGYTLLLGTASTHVISPFIVKTMPLELLRWLVIVVVLYAAAIMAHAAWKGRREHKAEAATTAVTAA